MEDRNAKGAPLEEFLAKYDDSLYRHPSNTVDMILMTVIEGKLKLLLVKRKDHPFIHDWALPGGFINFDEDMETAVMRELQEETNITDQTYFRQLYTFGNADRDPRTRVITTCYLSMTPADNIRNTLAGDDAEETGWFTLEKTTLTADADGRDSVLTLSCGDIRISYSVFDRAKNNYIETRSELHPDSNAKLAADHIKAVNMAVDLLRSRAASTGILFNLLPEEVTLRQIQTAYEAVIGRPTDTGNFRRDIKKMLINTGHTTKAGNKYAALYRFNPMYSYLKENL